MQLEECYGILVRKEIKKKHAYVVASHLPAWLQKLYRHKILTSLMEEYQKVALEAK